MASYSSSHPQQAAQQSYHSYQQQEQQEPTTSNSSKRSKRQLQKALRAGQFDAHALNDNNNVTITQMEQARPSAYVPQEETYAVPANGVKVTTTQMYNPSAGTNVQADLNLVKGKNQINHLMASAAQLELQQARGAGSKANSQRAGAKRKYGW
jgi:hypothetical protein